MKMVFLVLPLALVLAAVAVYAFVWAARSGQYDDLDTPARRMLHDDVPSGGQQGESGSPEAGETVAEDAEPAPRGADQGAR